MASPTILRSESFQLRRKILFIPKRRPEPWQLLCPAETRPCSISGFNCTRDHATRFELSCDLRAASNWGVLHVCHRRGCHRSHPLACAPPLAAVGIRRLELALSRLLPFLAPEESQWRSHHISLSLCPAALPTLSRSKPGRPYLDVVRRHLAAAVFCPTICYQECGGKRAK